MNYRMGWLDYPKAVNSCFDFLVLDKSIDKEHTIVNTILDELNIYKNKALGKSLELLESINLSSKVLFLKFTEEVETEGYKITFDEIIEVSARDYKGLLTGVYRVIALEILEKLKKGYVEVTNPDNPLRFINHWDNFDGSIERGYSGKSFFYKNNEVIINERTKDYARLLASVGINACVINNVNVKESASYLTTERYRKELIEISKIFQNYGIKLFISINFASPLEIGGLSTCDPLDQEVIKWWEGTSKDLFENVENFGGYLVKADSEGRPGPFTYNRNHAEGANMLAKTVEKYGGLIIWRCFVYNCTQDWRDLKTDRARAAYDNFLKLDGEFAENVVLQIKNGPMDFQIREPISPLFGAMKKTNQILEVQIAQEYTGQQIDVCYLIPMFKEILDFKTSNGSEKDTVADIVSGRTFGNKRAGIATVVNTGDSPCWTGNDFAAANLYGYGRLGMKTSLSAEEIADEWIKLALSKNTEVVEKVKKILLNSRTTYEKYTTPFGIGWMVKPHFHYGVNIEGYEYDRWGTYHRADNKGIGVDRTSTGTGYVGQYFKENSEIYEDIKKCPEELLLFFHKTPYDFKMKNGKTLIQNMYDTHFEGVEEVKEFIGLWDSIKEYIPVEIYENSKVRFEKQLKNAVEWRDVYNSYFYRKSGVEDEKGRKIY